MLINKDEAVYALSEIEGARLRTQSMQRYRNTAPYFVVWGCIWVLANCLTEFAPAWGDKTWLVLSILGMAITVWLNVHGVRQATSTPVQVDQAGIRRWQVTALCWLLILAYFIANFALLPPLSAKQGNAYISMFWAFLYAFMGVWAGWRILVVGILTAAAILTGYFLITTYYFLWMGLVSGSLLILGGLWLRKV